MNDPIRIRLALLLQEKGVTMAAASRAIGRNHAYLQQFLKRGSPRRLDQEAAAALSDYLQVPLEEILPQAEAPALPAGNAVRTAAPPASAFASGAMRRDVPVLGATVGGSEGDFLLNGQEVDRVRRPPALEAMGEAFALYVQGDSMWPWRAPGSLVYLHPARPPRIGDHVVVELHAEAEGEERPCYVKRYLGRSPTTLRLGQYNPPREDIEIPLGRVRSLYRVMEWEELLGV